MSTELGSYPFLKKEFALRELLITHENQKVFRLQNFRQINNISEDLYTLMSQCDGSKTVAEIMELYSEESHPLLLEAMQSPVFQNTIELSPTPVMVQPYQVVHPVTQPIALDNILLHLTNACNFRCEHCYHNDYLSPNDITLDEIDDYFRQASEYGAGSFTISGGEPFLRKDLLDITRLLTKYYLPYVLNTNGFFITKDHLVELKKTSCFAVSVSLDGPSAEIHNAIRKNPLSWPKLMKLFPMIHESGPPLRVSSLLSKDWLVDLSQVDWLIDYLNEVGVVEWTLIESSPTGEAHRPEFQQTHKMNASEAVEISRYILGVLQKKQPRNIRSVVIGKLFHWRPGQEDTVLPVNGTRRYTTENSQNILCEIHKGLLMVEPDGTVPFCTLFKSRFPMVIGSLRSEPLSVLWEKLCQIRIDHAIPKRTLCSGCGLLKYCGGGCPGEDPTADSTNFLTTCDISSKTRIPFVQKDYDYAFSISQEKQLVGV